MVGLALLVLRLEVVHPRPAAFAVPRVEIGIIDSQIFALLVEHLVGFHLGVIDLNVRVLLEGNAIEPLCQPENALNHRLFLEVRAQVVVRNGILLVLEFLGVITPVPRLQRGVQPVRRSKLLQLLYLLTRRRHITIPQLVKQLIDFLRCFRHGLVERLLCIVLLAEQLCQCQAGVHDVDDNLRVVELAADATRVVSSVEFAADVTVVEVLHDGDIGRRLQVQQPAVQPLLFRIFPKQRLSIFVQTCKQCRVGEQHRPCIGGFQHILPIGKRQFAQFCRQLPIGLLIFGAEVCTVVGKRLVDIVQQFRLFFGEFQFVFGFIYRLNALEQPLVETDVCRVFRHLGRQLHFDTVQYIVGLRRGEVVEAARYDTEHLARFLVRLDGVLVGGRSRVIYYLIDVRQSLTHSLFESGHIVFGAYFVERIGLMGCLPLLVVEERVICICRLAFGGCSRKRYTGKCHSTHCF